MSSKKLRKGLNNAKNPNGKDNLSANKDASRGMMKKKNKQTTQGKSTAKPHPTITKIKETAINNKNTVNTSKSKRAQPKTLKTQGSQETSKNMQNIVKIKDMLNNQIQKTCDFRKQGENLK